MLGVLLTFRERPGVPICGKKEGEETRDSKSIVGDLPLKQQLKLCLSNTPFVLTGLGTSCIIIHMYVFTTLIGQLVVPFGITDSQFTTTMGLFVLGFGILGGIVFSIVLMYRPKWITGSAYLICIASMLFLGFFYYADKTSDRVEIEVACGVHGFFLLPILFVAYELAVMQTAEDGVGDTMSCGLINLTANFVGFVIAIALTPALA